MKVRNGMGGVSSYEDIRTMELEVPIWDIRTLRWGTKRKWVVKRRKPGESEQPGKPVRAGAEGEESDNVLQYNEDRILGEGCGLRWCHWLGLLAVGIWIVTVCLWAADGARWGQQNEFLIWLPYFWICISQIFSLWLSLCLQILAIHLDFYS